MEVIEKDRDEKVRLLKTFFSGNPSSYGLETSNGPICVHEPITDQVLLDHIEGKKRVGVYPLIEDKINFGSADFDETPWETIKKFIAECIDKNLYPQLERSKRRDLGLHVFFFIDQPILAKDFRKAMDSILRRIGLDPKSIEVFPKQDSIGGDGVGNFIFLPLYGKSVKENRTVFLDFNFKPYPDQLKALKAIYKTKAEDIKTLAENLSPIGEEATPEELRLEISGDGLIDVEGYLRHYGIPFKVKKQTNRTFYLLNRCLFADSHTTKDNLGDSSIIQGTNGKLGYQCFHNHCQSKTWKDARLSISGEDSLSQFIRKPNPYSTLLLNADDLISLAIPPRKIIISPWLFLQQILLIHGWRGVGKTMFAILSFDAITRAEAVGPWPLLTPAACLYIDGEMALIDIQDRLKILSAGKTPRKAPLMIYSDAQANSLGLPRANLINSQWRKDVKSLMLDNGIQLVALDNIASLAPGLDENSKKDWDPINQWLIDLRFSDIAVILLHHENKVGGQRGTSAREDNIDTSISLTRPHDYRIEDGCRFIVKFKKSRLSTKDISLLQDYEFKLINNNGRNEWAWSPVRIKNKIEIIRKVDEGIKQEDIAEILGVSKGFVSQVKTKAIKDGQLDSHGKLTPEGRNLVNQGSLFEEEEAEFSY